MDKRKLNIVIEILQAVSVEFPHTQGFIEEHLEQKCQKENISSEEVIYFFDKPISKEPARQTFFSGAV